MKQSIELLTLTVIAAGTIAAGRFVTWGGAQAGAAANTQGVANSDAVANDALPVIAIGTAVVEAGAAISAGDAVETDSDGRAVTKDSGPTVGRALEEAGAAGDFIEVLLIQN